MEGEGYLPCVLEPNTGSNLQVAMCNELRDAWRM
jgi:hypothetical protein